MRPPFWFFGCCTKNLEIVELMHATRQVGPEERFSRWSLLYESTGWFRRVITLSIQSSNRLQSSLPVVVENSRILSFHAFNLTNGLGICRSFTDSGSSLCISISKEILGKMVVLIFREIILNWLRYCFDWRFRFSDANRWYRNGTSIEMSDILQWVVSKAANLWHWNPSKSLKMKGIPLVTGVYRG